jgi:hypothetical protein
LLKTFSLEIIPFFAHLNVLVSGQVDNIVKLLEEILKHSKIGRRWRRTPRPVTQGVEADRRAFA